MGTTMSDSEVLDTTEKIRKRLEIEYHICDRTLTDSVLNCLGYKTSYNRTEGRKPSICPQWKHFHPIIDLRESLRYRLGSLIWHCRQFSKYQQEYAERISKLKLNGKDYHNETRDAYYIASYILDDVVFCSVSSFDYFAQLIYKINHPEKRGKKFWSNLVAHCDFEDPELSNLIKKTNDELVRSLSRLRGRSIHTQADIGALKQTESFDLRGITHTFEYLMPQEALRRLPFFDETKEFPIEPGAYLIALHTIIGIRKILIQLGRYEYACVFVSMKIVVQKLVLNNYNFEC